MPDSDQEEGHKEAEDAQHGSNVDERCAASAATSSGLYTYVLSHVDSVMCHRFQKSKNEEAEKGRSKFSGRRTRIRRARAITNVDVTGEIGVEKERVHDSQPEGGKEPECGAATVATSVQVRRPAPC